MVCFTLPSPYAINSNYPRFVGYVEQFKFYFCLSPLAKGKSSKFAPHAQKVSLAHQVQDEDVVSSESCHSICNTSLMSCRQSLLNNMVGIAILLEGSCIITIGR